MSRGKPYATEDETAGENGVSVFARQDHAP